MELTSLQWGMIILALQEAKTMPKKSLELADELAELTEAQY
jgi:ABC-type anion transport system duplicated permease subunit